MAKNSPAVPAVQSASATVQVQDQISSLKDGAYKQALASDRVRSVARYVMDKCKTFPETVPDEVKAELYAGYQLRFNEANKADRYAIVNDHYLLIDGSNPALEDEREKIVIGVDYAMSFTQQQYGKLKNENPYLHAIIKSWRDRINTYCSNRLGDLKKQARGILSEGKPRDRSPTADFAHRLEDVFKDLRIKCDNAQKRGDETADKKKFDLARTAFMTAWTK